MIDLSWTMRDVILQLHFLDPTIVWRADTLWRLAYQKMAHLGLECLSKLAVKWRANAVQAR